MINSLLIRRHGMMAGDGIVLPPGYTRVPSVYGRTSGAYFDSGIAGNQDGLRFIVRAKKGSSVNYYSAFFGNYSSESKNVTRIVCSNTFLSVLGSVNSKANDPLIYSVNPLDWHVYELSKENGVLTLTIDGVVHSKTPQNGTANSANIAVNASSIGVSVNTGETITRFSQFDVYLNGTPIRKYIPCVDPSNKVGFYDVVNNTFITSVNNSYPFYVGT